RHRSEHDQAPARGDLSYPRYGHEQVTTAQAADPNGEFVWPFKKRPEAQPLDDTDAAGGGIDRGPLAAAEAILAVKASSPGEPRVVFHRGLLSPRFFR